MNTTLNHRNTEPTIPLVKQQVAHSVGKDPLSCLTWREQDVLGCLLLRLRNKEIADQLGVETSTVKTHMHHLLEKFGVRSRRDLAARFEVSVNRRLLLPITGHSDPAATVLVVKQNLAQSASKNRLSFVSRREQDVLDCLLLRFRDKEMADQLGVQTCTVKTHMRHLLEKFGVRSRRELAARLEGPVNRCLLLPIAESGLDRTCGTDRMRRCLRTQ